MARGAIKDECVRVLVGDVGLKWDAPEFCFGASPPFDNRRFGHCGFDGASVVDVDLVAVADGDVACFSKLSSAEEGLVGQGRYYVNCLGWFPESVFQFCDGCGWGRVAVCQSENLG